MCIPTRAPNTVQESTTVQTIKATTKTRTTTTATQVAVASSSSPSSLASLRMASLNRYEERQKSPMLSPQRMRVRMRMQKQQQKQTESQKLRIVSPDNPGSRLPDHSACRLRWRCRWFLPEITIAVIVYMVASACIVPGANALVKCPIGCSCDDEALVVKCSEGVLDVLPITLNPFTQRLVITNNKKIRRIDSSITFYAELTFLDLSYNELVNIPAHTFENQKKLRELNLSRNKIGQVDSATFAGLSMVTVLNLRGNLIAELGRNTFVNVGKVEELNLGENRISTIDTHAFDGLVNLRVLYLDDNTLTTVPAAATYESMPNLAELFLGTNSFESLPSGVFEHINGLTRLDLRSAGLVHNISKEALKGLEGLRYLDLSDNHLHEVPTAALSHLHRLEELSLGQNDFEVILPDAFAGLKNLRRLEVVGAPRLERITNGAFSENTNLEYLNFSGNKMLSIIEENAVRGLPHLRRVILRENRLSTLAEGLFPWEDLETLDLTDNPFVCDCNVVWLRNLVASNNMTSNTSSDGGVPGTGRVANVICASPEQFHGMSLVQLSSSELGCSHINSNSQALISLLIVGVTVIISALVFLIYGCRQRIREALKGRWGNSALGRKEREYQKTFSDEETRQQHPCLGLGVHPTIASSPYAGDHHNANYSLHSPAYMGTRPIPVTEL